MKAIVGVLLFVGGAAAGAAGSYIYCKKKYAKISDEEVASVKAYYKDRYTSKVNECEKLKISLSSFQRSSIDIPAEEVAVAPEKDKEVSDDIKEKSSNKKEVVDYTKFSKEDEDSEDEEIMEDEIDHSLTHIEIISATEFDQDLEYDKLVLTWYEKDQVLADDNDDILDPMEDYIGSAAIRSFGEFEEDTVFVRNHRLEVCYEVVREYRSYKSVTGRPVPGR